jgi:hypothetical protein
MNPELALTGETNELFLSLQTRGLNLTVTVTHPSWGIGMTGELEDFTIGEVRLVLEGLVSMGTLVDVHVGGGTFAGEVLYCQRRGNRFETHISINDFDESGLRRTPRFPVKVACMVSAASLETPTIATIVDISGDGLGIELSADLPINATIAVESESTLALGVVRYSRRSIPQLFRVGVQLHHIVNKTTAPTVLKPRTGFLGKVSSRFAFGGRSAT